VGFYPATFLKGKGHISAGDRGFVNSRFNYLRKQTIWQKAKMAFLAIKIEIIQVDKLDDINRNGFGASGKK
jgi:hypothetical protein